MSFSSALKRLYLKITVLFVIFLGILGVYFFLFNFYAKKLLNKINQINSLKEQILQNQVSLEKENKSKKIVTLINQKTNKELSAILFAIQQKLNRNFEVTKNLVLEKLKKENWQVKVTNFNQQENKLNFVFQLPDNDFENFYNFMIDSGLIWQIISFKINKIDNFWEVDLTLQLQQVE